MASGATWLYEITVPSDVRNDFEVVYLELNQNLNIRVRDAGRKLLYSSSSAEFFGRGGAGIASANTDLDAQAINATTACRGSCVIFEPGSQGTYFLEVTNNTSSSVTYDLFAFGDDFADEFEPENNVRATAPTLAVGPSLDESGALETVGDVDYWFVNGNAAVAFDAAANQLGIRADVVDNGGNRLSSHAPGSTINVRTGQYLRVFSNSDRAAASAASVYYLSSP